MKDDLTPVLARLPEPTPPATMTATVMARIARDEERPAATEPVRHRERSVWLWTFVGLAAVLGVQIYGGGTTGAAPDFISPRIGFGNMLAMPGAGPLSLLLGCGLLVYLAGLFAPLRRGRSTDR